MKQYTIDNTLRVAKRYKNAKRSWLLVNPLQAKHIPVSPTVSLEMMRTLGNRLAEDYPTAKLVVGFAETATAIGAAVASCLSEDCVYVHTTREPLGNTEGMICFQEEHSHAVEQMLYGGKLEAWLDATDTVLLVEDEISTGKTMVNMVKQLKAQYPALAEKKLVAASVLNRVSEENMQLMADNGIDCVYLVKLPDADYTAAVAELSVAEAAPACACEAAEWNKIENVRLPDPRVGVSVGEYEAALSVFCDGLCDRLEAVLNGAGSVLVLGTEECMYPAIKLGEALEQRFAQRTVRTHATTRSPIGVTDAADYPIFCGVKLQSLYDGERTTYLYDLAKYDAVLIVTDAAAPANEGVSGLVSGLGKYGNENFYLITGGSHVWNV